MDIKPNIIIVDENLIYRKCLICIITGECIGNVIGEFSDVNDLMQIHYNLHPDVVLMDIDIQDMIGIIATQKILRLVPDLKVIACSSFIEEEYYYNLNELGFKGFFLKSGGIHQLEKILKDVLL